MLKKAITFTDYNGVNRTKTYYFNLSAAELIKLEMSTMMISEDMQSTTGGLQEHIQDVIASRSGKRIIEMFDMFVDASYGERSEDGLRFVKTPEVLLDFKATPAYDAFFMQLVTDANFGSEFLNGIMPSDLVAQAETLKGDSKPTQTMKGVEPHLMIVDEVASMTGTTNEEEMTDVELLDALGALTVVEEKEHEKDYSQLTPAELRALPRHELMAAFKQKNARKK